MKYPVALIIGRFQPFHKGHLFLIKKALDLADKIIIGIGSANISDENNPIDFETRKKVIKAVFYKEGVEERLIKIVPLDDFFDDRKWLENVKKQVGDFDLVVGNNDWTNNILEKAGYKILRVDYYKRDLFEGWRIRKLIKEGKKWQDRVPKYLISNFKFLISNKFLSFKTIVLGGTFDHFHKGHHALIDKAFEVGKKVVIGIATEELFKGKFLSETIESFEVRKGSVEKYIKKADIISFSDIYGATLKEKNINAIVVSRETLRNALKINEERKKIHFKSLQIVVVEDVLAEDGKPISSTRIRAGEIDREGKNYQFSPDLIGVQKKEILMPESLRPTLQKPLGKVFKNEKALLRCIDTSKHTMIIAVGDIIVDSLLKNNIDPDVKIIDFRSRRRVIPAEAGIHENMPSIKSKLINKPGTINLETAEIIKEKIRLALYEKKKSWIIINGEEDLLALPAILFAPLNSLVLYGHWQLGIIVVGVNEKIKNKVNNIVKKFL